MVNEDLGIGGCGRLDVVVAILAVETVAFALGDPDHEPKDRHYQGYDDHQHHGNGPPGGILAGMFEGVCTSGAGENRRSDHNSGG